MIYIIQTAAITKLHIVLIKREMCGPKMCYRHSRSNLRKESVSPTSATIILGHPRLPHHINTPPASLPPLPPRVLHHRGGWRWEPPPPPTPPAAPAITIRCYHPPAAPAAARDLQPPNGVLWGGGTEDASPPLLQVPSPQMQVNPTKVLDRARCFFGARER
jgi:hypothetical protein